MLFLNNIILFYNKIQYIVTNESLKFHVLHCIKNKRCVINFMVEKTSKQKGERVQRKKEKSFVCLHFIKSCFKQKQFKKKE